MSEPLHGHSSSDIHCLLKTNTNAMQWVIVPQDTNKKRKIVTRVHLCLQCLRTPPQTWFPKCHGDDPALFLLVWNFRQRTHNKNAFHLSPSPNNIMNGTALVCCSIFNQQIPNDTRGSVTYVCRQGRKRVSQRKGTSVRWRTPAGVW